MPNLQQAYLRHARHYEGVLRATNQSYKQGGEGVVKGLRSFDHEWANIKAGYDWSQQHEEQNEEAAAICSQYPDAGVFCLNLRQTP